MKKNYSNPSWWQPNYDSTWERVKSALQRDWDQTKHDLGGKVPDTRQDVDDTVKQAAGKQPIPPRGAPTYEKLEPAYRLGYGARRHYERKYPEWNQSLEQELERDWVSVAPEDQRDWPSYRDAVRRGWEYDERERKL